MVQRKTPTKIIKPQINDPKNAADQQKSKKKPSSDAQQQHQVHNQQQQEHVGSKMKQVVDFKKMMKKARSIKLIENDLLRDKTPTPQKNKPSSSSSSSQKKTKSSSSNPNYLKPTSSSDAMKSSKSSNINSNTSRASSSTADNSGGKTLMKRLSFRLIKPWMRKSSEIVLVNSNPIAEVKPTCSSTLKDSNFPKTLELNPGGREAEGTSVYKVCPYNHCSLNGHHHRHDEPPPPLRRVISVRRRMLKTQKRERLKSLASFKIRGSRKSRNEVHSEVVITRVPSMRAPVIEEVTDDYFVKIYEQPQSQKAVDVIDVDENRVHEEFEDEISEVLNCLLLEGGEEGCENGDEIYELGSELGYEDEFDRYSDISIEEMDVVMDFLEYIECDEETGLEYQEKYAGEWGFDSMENIGHAESITNLSNFESTDSYWDEDTRSNIEQSNDLCQYLNNEDPEEEERLNPECRECISDEFPESRPTNEQACGCYDINQEKISDAEIDELKVNHDIGDQEVLKEFECDTESESSEKSEVIFVNVNSELPGQTSMKVCDHVDDATDNISAERMATSMENTILALCDEEKENRIEEFAEDDDGNSLIKIQFSNAPGGFYEIDMELPEESDAMNMETEQYLNENSSRPKARYNYIRKRTAEDVHDMKQFNPRAPNLLPEAPDQEREKVDLRHQEMEDRKNAEEWMVDYTLQRTVSKLARARSRKVRLFVEAFETVIKPSLHV